VRGLTLRKLRLTGLSFPHLDAFFKWFLYPGLFWVTASLNFDARDGSDGTKSYVRVLDRDTDLFY